MLALVDGDIVVYRIGFTTEQNDWHIARWRANEMMEGILADVNASEFRVYLSDSTKNGFRAKLLPTYKANRVQPRPKHYDALKEYLLTHWDARIALGEEADDRLGIDQCSVREYNLTRDSGWPWKDSCICSIDKDLLQIPGRHYNFIKKEWWQVNDLEGEHWFWKQVLTGDVTDNIKGIPGIGPVKAERILSKVVDPRDYFTAVLEAYQAAFKEDAYLQLLINARLVKIRTREGELWNFPTAYTSLQPSLDNLLSSTLLEQEENDPSTVPTITR